MRPVYLREKHFSEFDGRAFDDASNSRIALKIFLIIRFWHVRLNKMLKWKINRFLILEAPQMKRLGSVFVARVIFIVTFSG